MPLPPTPIGFDASVLINFCVVHRLDLLVAATPAPRIVLIDVLEELGDLTCRSNIDQAIGQGDIELTELQTDSELESWASYTKRLDAGESALLAAAAERGWSVAIDEKAARRIATADIGPDRLVGTVGILREAVRLGLIETDEGNRLLAAMVEAGFWSPVERLTDD